MMYERRTRHNPPDGPYRGSLSLGLPAFVLGALLMACWSCLRRSHRERLHTKPAALPKRLQTWEGEGGRVDPEPGEGGADAAVPPPAAV